MNEPTVSVDGGDNAVGRMHAEITTLRCQLKAMTEERDAALEDPLSPETRENEDWTTVFQCAKCSKAVRVWPHECKPTCSAPPPALKEPE